jgi:hypothetical protein
MNLPDADKQPWLLRVLGHGNGIAGVGFLVGRDAAITCAHVVNSALNLPVNNQSVPRELIDLDWPLLPGCPHIMADVLPHGWHPITEQGRGDIAILRLRTVLPSGARPVPWVRPKSLWQHKYRTFGFPTGHDQGQWVHGRLLSPNGMEWVQLESASMAGASLEKGFSGAPVWDDTSRGVVGMIVSYDRAKASRIGYMLPHQLLLRAIEIVNLGDQLTTRRLHFKDEREYATSELDLAGIFDELEQWLTSQRFATTRNKIEDGIVLKVAKIHVVRGRYQIPGIKACVIRATSRRGKTTFGFGPPVGRALAALSLGAPIVFFAPQSIPYLIPAVIAGLTAGAAVVPILSFTTRVAEVTDELVYSGKYGLPPALQPNPA